MYQQSAYSFIDNFFCFGYFFDVSPFCFVSDFREYLNVVIKIENKQQLNSTKKYFKYELLFKWQKKIGLLTDSVILNMSIAT